MAILDFEPCYLYKSETVEANAVNDDGNRIPSVTNFSKYLRCDIVPAGQANQMDFGDGKLQTYSYTIYVYDKDCKDFSLGERIKFEKDGKLSKPFYVKGFHRYQHQCKIWI